MPHAQFPIPLSVIPVISSIPVVQLACVRSAFTPKNSVKKYYAPAGGMIQNRVQLGSYVKIFHFFDGHITGRNTNPALKNVAVNCQAAPLSKLDKIPKILPTSLT